jgi:hypothetical protein
MDVESGRMVDEDDAAVRGTGSKLARVDRRAMRCESRTCALALLACCFTSGSVFGPFFERREYLLDPCRV